MKRSATSIIRQVSRASRAVSSTRNIAAPSTFEAHQGDQLFRPSSHQSLPNAPDSTGSTTRRSTSRFTRSESAGDSVLQLGGQEIPRSGQRHRGLGREQVHALQVLAMEDVLLRSRGMRRHAPGGLLGDGPQPVRDLVEEAAAVLEALRDDERRQAFAALEVRLLVARAVAVAGELHVEGGGQRRPRLSPVPARPLRRPRYGGPGATAARAGGPTRRGRRPAETAATRREAADGRPRTPAGSGWRAAWWWTRRVLRSTPPRQRR